MWEIREENTATFASAGRRGRIRRTISKVAEGTCVKRRRKRESASEGRKRWRKRWEEEEEGCVPGVCCWDYCCFCRGGCGRGRCCRLQPCVCRDGGGGGGDDLKVSPAKERSGD